MTAKACHLPVIPLYTWTQLVCAVTLKLLTLFPYLCQNISSTLFEFGVCFSLFILHFRPHGLDGWVLLSLGLLVSVACCNKLSYVFWLWMTDIYSPTILQARVWNLSWHQDCWQGCAQPVSLGEDPRCVSFSIQWLPALSDPWPHHASSFASVSVSNCPLPLFL